MKFKVFWLSATLLTAGIGASYAGTWELPGIYGNAPDVWKDGRNWKWDEGNPISDNGAKWTVVCQLKKDGEIKEMSPGKAYKFNFVWRDAGDSFDPAAMFKETALSCASLKEGPGEGPISAIVFTPEMAGKFKVEAEGEARVQNPSAGNAMLSVAVVDAKLAVLREVKSFALNTKGGHGGYPDSFSVSEDLELKAGERLALILRSVNPGPASSGKSSATFKSLKISSE